MRAQNTLTNEKALHQSLHRQRLITQERQERVFEALTADRDNKYLMLDSTIVRAHQQAASGKGGKDQALGRSRGGLTTKIHMLADGLGRPLRLIVTAGQALLADKAYDSNAFRKIIAEMGAQVVIPSNRTRKILIPYDEVAYKQRNRIERCFSLERRAGD